MTKDRISRADFLKRGALVGLGAVSVGALSGCTSQGADEDARDEERAQLTDGLARLEDKMAIEELMSDYWWLLDSKQFDKMVDGVFVEDTKFYMFNPGSETMAEPTIIADTARQWADDQKTGLADLITVHQGHQYKIQFKDDEHAVGRFVLNGIMTPSDKSWQRTAYGYYVNDFAKVDGAWKMTVSRLGYIMVQTGAAPAKVEQGGFPYPEGEML